ncbi:hypothetical protein GG864_22220 [Salmonella enterica]|nr:hypothetical protein [Salmonella enterica]EDK8307375.1 hypothetical protein [Salmonella enterica]
MLLKIHAVKLLVFVDDTGPAINTHHREKAITASVNDQTTGIIAGTVAECVIDKLCPSHTVVVFTYPEGKENAQN